MALPAERRQKILEFIKTQRSVTCAELCQQFEVSLGTVRNDLEQLESTGYLKRTYGGAMLLDEPKEKTVRVGEREVIHAEIKDQIGMKAAELVGNDETIFIDASTTSLFLAKHLRGKKNLTVITNAERVVMALSREESIRVICIGGMLRKDNLSYVGEMAENFIRTSFYADKVFFSCYGISQKFGLFDAVESEANLKKAMFSSARQAILLCDSSKFEKIGFPKLADWDILKVIITDKKPNSLWYGLFEKHGIDIVF